MYARARARETYLLPARCTSARETLHDDSSKACAQLRAGVFRLSRASRRYRRSCPKSRFATFAYPSRGREHEREIPGSASSALMPGTRWCKKKSVAIPFEEGDRFRARVLARTLLYVLSHFYARVRFLLVFFELRTVQYVYNVVPSYESSFEGRGLPKVVLSSYSSYHVCVDLITKRLSSNPIKGVHVAYCTCIEYESTFESTFVLSYESTKVLPYESIYFLTYLRTYLRTKILALAAACRP